MDTDLVQIGYGESKCIRLEHSKIDDFCRIFGVLEGFRRRPKKTFVNPSQLLN
jgi:hypothetical protein